MPTPEGLNTTTLHMKFVEPNATGTPLQGSLTFTPNPSPILFPTENVIVAGTETATLDVNGEATIELISTDQAGENPTGWLYSVTEKLIGQKQRTYNISLLYNGGVTLELADLVPTDVAPNYIPVVGPQGAPGVITTINGHSAATVNLTAADVGAIDATEKGAASGVATLTAAGKHTAAQYDGATVQLLSGKDQVSGYVGIDANGKVGIGIVGPWARSMVQTALNEVAFAVVQTNAAATSPGFLVQGAAATWGAFGASVAGDANNRINFTAGGQLSWGDGTAAADTTLARSGVGELTVGGQMVASAAAPTAVGHLTRKDYVDGNFVGLANTQTITGLKTFSGNVTLNNGFTVSGSSGASSAAAAGTTAWRARVTGDAVDRWAVTGDGTITWGSGAGSRDTTLSRTGVNELTSGGQLIISTAAPTAAGHVTRKDYVDNNFSSLTGAQTISGVKTYTSAPIMQAAAAGTVVSKFQVTGDTTPRLTIGADGTLSFGPGNAAADIVVSRTTGSSLSNSSNWQSSRAATSNTAYTALVTGDAFDRFRIYADGLHEWGPGNAGRDTNLYRASANLLQTDDALSVLGTITAANFPSGAWSSWTPTWSTSSGSALPSFGNATVNCTYTKHGRTVWFKMDITFGSTTNFGSGATTGDNWTMTLPVAAANTNDPVGVASYKLGSTSDATMGHMVLNGSTTVCQFYAGAGATDGVSVNGGIVDSLSPRAWANGSRLCVSGCYEAAS